MFIAFEELHGTETLFVNPAHVVTANVERRNEAPVLLRLTFAGERSSAATLYFGPEDLTDAELASRQEALRNLLNGDEARGAWTKASDAEVRGFKVELR
ncbi:TPA: hypothetical protein IYE61_002895 [Enterococcus faecium]|nr:hypothetical protein [Enterococcus faecium]